MLKSHITYGCTSNSSARQSSPRAIPSIGRPIGTPASSSRSRSSTTTSSDQCVNHNNFFRKSRVSLCACSLPDCEDIASLTQRDGLCLSVLCGDGASMVHMWACQSNSRNHFKDGRSDVLQSWRPDYALRRPSLVVKKLGKVGALSRSAARRSVFKTSAARHRLWRY